MTDRPGKFVNPDGSEIIMRDDKCELSEEEKLLLSGHGHVDDLASVVMEDDGVAEVATRGIDIRDIEAFVDSVITFFTAHPHNGDYTATKIMKFAVELREAINMMKK